MTTSQADAPLNSPPISRDRILTTHVGSLPRDPELTRFIFAKDAGEAYDGEAFEACLKQAVETVVARQVEVGIDIVSDGEFSKISYSTYISERLSGTDGGSLSLVGRELASIVAADVRTTARSTTFSSSRTLPGQL